MNEKIKKLFKPPYIFILLGVIVLAIFMKNKNSGDVQSSYDEATQQGFDVFSLMEQFDSANEVLENYIDMNSENIQVISEKLDDNIIQLSDLIRTRDESLKEDIQDLKDDLDDRKTTVIPKAKPKVKTTSTKSKSKTVTVGTWGKDPISRTTLSGIAKNAGISLNKLLSLNPQYKSNPDLIHPGDKVKVS